jgi:hypothetical protein
MKTTSEDCNHKKWNSVHCGGGSAVYGIGMIGALVYYFQHVTTFAEGIAAIFHSIFWPAFVIYKVLEVLKM